MALDEAKAADAAAHPGAAVHGCGHGSAAHSCGHGPATQRGEDAPAPRAAPSRSRFALRLLGLLAVIALLFGALFVYWPDIAAWAASAQRGLQTELARAVRAVRAGDPGALFLLIGASFLYGLAHAVGPGHGKMVIGGAAAASRRTAWRMAGIGFAASMTQAASAILLAYGALGFFSLTGRQATAMAEGVLAPLSAAAIALIGLWIAWGGLRMLLPSLRPAAVVEGACASGCRHGPTAAEAERAETWAGAAALVISIGLRPCSGALIVLAIAWNFQLYLAGALAAVAISVGVGLVVAGVALAATALRDAGALRREDRDSLRLFALVRMAAGLALATVSGAVVLVSLGA